MNYRMLYVMILDKIRKVALKYSISKRGTALTVSCTPEEGQPS